MSDKAIIVNGIGKAYRIGRKRRGELHTGPVSPESTAKTSKPRGITHWNVFRQRPDDTFWALKDLDFEIGQGEAVGIIGRNGAGKSTLLKILSRITRPTTGSFSIDGRVSSLLEVGTGFHPELTGRENIFLNGTILGMKRREVKEKFDEIVAFSGVEDFIDTPVKHYSSGMKVRLAFSVAAHLDPEILIIDEVLAVGDAEFQRKCLGKMETVASEGRTVLFVSHNLSAVQNLCTRGLLVDKGEIICDSTSERAIKQYIESAFTSAQKSYNLQNAARSGEGKIVFTSLTYNSFPFSFGEDISFMVSLAGHILTGKNYDIDFGVAIQNEFDQVLVHCSNRFINRKLLMDESEKSFEVRIANQLKPGGYNLVLFLRINGIIQDWIRSTCPFEIADGNPYGYNNTSEISGLLLPEFDIIE